MLTSEIFENVRSGLATIEESSKLIISFITKYRQLTSLPQPVKTESDIVVLLNNIINMYSDTHGDELRIKTNLPQTGISIAVDPDLITMALSNIIKNGLEACERIARPRSIDFRKKD